MVIIDTSAWVDFLDGYSSEAARELREILSGEEDVFYTGLILQEILQGIREVKRRTEIRQDFEPFLLIMPTLATHIAASEMYLKCRDEGITIRKSIDCVIAALALEHDLEVLHKDRDFNQIASVYPLRIR